MDQLKIIVPVASFEPLSVLKRSVDSICDLECGGLDVRIVYVLDIENVDDCRLKFLEEVSIASNTSTAPNTLTDSITVIARTDNRGRRAGAVNDALDSLDSRGISPDYIALFDVDSRPRPNFLIECVDAMRSNRSAIIASGARFVTNEDESIVSRTIAAEYLFFSDVYRLFRRFGGFNQFNGLIGVLDVRLMEDYRFNRLNESVPCEDLEFTQRAYLAGLTGVFTPKTLVGEQAPVSVGDLFNQRVRWLSGAYLGLRRYLPSFISSKIPVARKLAWFLALFLPFVAFLATPLVPLYGVRLLAKYGLFRAIVRTVGLIGHLWLITICGVVVLVKQVSGTGIEWKESRRSEV